MVKNDLEEFLRSDIPRRAFLRRNFAIRRAGVGLDSTVKQDATVSCVLGDILANDLTALNSPLALGAFFQPSTTQLVCAVNASMSNAFEIIYDSPDRVRHNTR